MPDEIKNPEGQKSKPFFKNRSRPTCRANKKGRPKRTAL
jgi:hypothetical protein